MQQSDIQILEAQKQQIRSKLPHKNKDLERSDNGSMIMNERNLRIICENQGLYEFPEMNTKIYLHFKVIQKIQNLDKYINLRTIYLENNVITKIQNLDCLVNLQNLFLQNNMIKKMENLEKLKDLRVLNLSNNNIFKIEGISQLPMLQNLCMANNYLTEFEDLQQLGRCTIELTSIDLSSNQIKPNHQLFNLIPQVKCLYLSGNPLVRQTKHYRRIVVGTLKNLLYLDQRGIDQEQRMLSDAWVEGGQPAFKLEKEKVYQHRQNVKQQKKKQIIKDIDVHRNRKISIFQRNIREFEEQIEKLRGYMNEKGNEDQTFFYETQIAQLYQKIRQNQEFVNNLNKRIGAAAKSISSGMSNGCNESEKSICSEDNKSEGEIKTESLSEGQEKEIMEENDDQEDMQTDFPQENFECSQRKVQVKEQYERKEQEKSELSFQKSKAQQKKVQRQMTPATSTGLDELD